MKTIERTGRGHHSALSATPRIKVRTRRHGDVLFDLHGASLEIQNRGEIPEATIRVMHPNGTDFEHDSSTIVMLTLYGVAFQNYWAWGEIEFSGYLHGAQYYPDGVEPTLESDRDTDPGTCRDCEEPHPFMPYQPPEQEVSKRPVWIEISTAPPEEPSDG